MALLGVDALKRRYGSVKTAIENGDVFEEAGREWIDEDFKPEAQRLCPKDTGYLADSIDGEVNPKQVRVFAEADYGVDVEYGTTKMQAQPFMAPAFNRTRPKFSEHCRKALKRRLD